MRIYIIPAWYPRDAGDPSACFIREQAHALADRGHDVTVIHIKSISIKNLFKHHSEKRIWQDGNVRTIYYSQIIPIPGKISKIQDKYISKVYTNIIGKQISEDEKEGKLKPDLIHAHVSHSCAYYCIGAKKKFGIPFVVTEHYSGLLLGTASDDDYKRVRKTINECDAFIFVGSNFQNTLCNRLNITKHTYVIPNMINFNDYHIKEHNNSEFCFLTACYLVKNKSVDLIIKAFHKAFEKQCNIKLLIAGDGVERDSLVSLCNEIGENGRIEFLGRYSRDRAPDIFSSADAFVLTSKVETFGVVYVESLACGLPCIATKGQGAEDIIDDSNGIKVEYGNIDELVKALQYVYHNRDIYDSKTIRSKCEKEFSEASVCERIEKIYDSCLDLSKMNLD